MELTVEEIQRYLHCPAEYDFRFNKKISTEDAENVKFKKAIHKTIYYLYFSMMGGWIPTAKQMKDKWASIWQEELDGSQSITEQILKEHNSRTPSRVDKRIIQGYELIHNFYHNNKEDFGIPIAVDHEFRVPIAGVTVVGNFELIRETLDKQSPSRFIEIVDFKTGNEVTDRFLLTNDLTLTIMSYAFRNLFQTREDRLTYSYMKSGSEVHTRREERQFDRMKAIVEGVAEGIANKRYYPRQTFMCKGCSLKDTCNIAEF